MKIVHTFKACFFFWFDISNVTVHFYFLNLKGQVSYVTFNFEITWHIFGRWNDNIKTTKHVPVSVQSHCAHQEVSDLTCMQHLWARFLAVRHICIYLYVKIGIDISNFSLHKGYIDN